jgi:hypothetical protein
MPSPVLLLRGAARPKSARWSTIPPDRTIDVLVPLDGSRLAETVLDPTLGLVQALAGPQPAEVHLVQVVPLHPLGFGGGTPEAAPGADRPADTSQGDAVAAAATYLRRMADWLRPQVSAEASAPHSAQISRPVSLETEVAPAIVLLAERGQHLHHPFDLIAMSTHGENGWER